MKSFLHDQIHYAHARYTWKNHFDQNKVCHIEVLTTEEIYIKEKIESVSYAFLDSFRYFNKLYFEK